MRQFLIIIFLTGCSIAHSQELYVFSEPASNMPVHSLSVKGTYKGLKNRVYNATDSRYSTELMFGISKELMIHASGSFSNMYAGATGWESGRLYAKYRFLSDDDLYSHFRMAAYAEGSYSRNKTFLDDYGLDGDRSGVGAGLIATKLVHKLAISGTAGFRAITTSFTGLPATNLVDYSLSAGYLVLPVQYKSYDQTNLNLYVELLGERMLNNGSKHFIDIAPAAQLIFNSQAKLNLGYRFQLDGNMYRSANNSWLVSFEWLFLNTF